MQLPPPAAIPSILALAAAAGATGAAIRGRRAGRRVRDLEDEHLPPCVYPPGCDNGPDPHPRREGCIEFETPAPEPEPEREGPCGCGACSAEIDAAPRPEGHAVDCFTPGCDSSCLETQPEPEPEGGTT